MPAVRGGWRKGSPGRGPGEETCSSSEDVLTAHLSGGADLGPSRCSTVTAAGGSAVTSTALLRCSTRSPTSRLRALLAYSQRWKYRVQRQARTRWLFFAVAYPAATARQAAPGCCARRSPCEDGWTCPVIGTRLFPSQDVLQAGPSGNLTAVVAPGQDSAGAGRDSVLP